MHISGGLLTCQCSHRPNYTSLTAPPAVDVSSELYHNEYTYAAWKLGAAYGAAILGATIAVAIGLTHIVISKACYSNSFSTIFRAARGADISAGSSINEQDLIGRDPLPKYLGNAEVEFLKAKSLNAAKISREGPDPGSRLLYS